MPSAGEFPKIYFSPALRDPNLRGQGSRKKRRIKVRPNGDTRLYVRAQQEDGHRMWSSPIYLIQD
jgi:hypothetical protein